MLKSVLCLISFVLFPALVSAWVPPAPNTFGKRLVSPFYVTVDPTEERSSKLKATETTTKITERNMFHAYDKPIVLLGSSSDGNELRRLAEYLLKEHFTASNGIIELATIGSADEISTIDTEELISAVNSKKYQWPNIFVLDFEDSMFSKEEGKYSDELARYYEDVAKALYEDTGLLSIYVNVDPNSSKMNEKASERKSKLDEFLVKYSDYEVCIRDEGTSKDDDDAWSHIEWEMTRVLARARLIAPIPGDKTRSENTAHLTMGENTFFLSLSFPEISQVEPYVQEMCQDVDAMEYRADLLDCRDNRFDLLYGLQLLRKYSRYHVVRVPALPFGGSVIEDVMPIVYTVRTQNQAGTYPDDEQGINKMFDLLSWGLRAGVEVLDVESAWDKTQTDKLLTLAEQRYTTQILGSHHVVGMEISTEQAVKLFQQCALEGRAHGAKVVLSIEDADKDRMAYEASRITRSLARDSNKPVIPNVSLILGEVGQYSRILNIPFTPVTHESLPFTAAPGQLTASEIMTTRYIAKIVTSKSYAILGHNIDYSVSPQMQGSAFAAARLPHKFLRADVPDVQEFVDSDFFQSDDFGGCAVTIPHKQAIMKHVDILSDAAKEIGSVNTLIVEPKVGEEHMERVIYGDNTDWKGIFNPLNRLLGGQVNPESDFVLILGAGGTARAAAYVARKLGLRPLYYNRTPSKAADLVENFGGDLLTSLDDSSSEDEMSLGSVLARTPNGALRVVLSTLPASAEFVLPDWVLDNDSASSLKPIIFDVNYKPYNTKLLLQTEEAGCDVVRGSEMLWEQGIGQFELWMRRTAPYSVMKQVVLVNCQPAEEKDTTEDSEE